MMEYRGIQGLPLHPRLHRLEAPSPPSSPSVPTFSFIHPKKARDSPEVATSSRWPTRTSSAPAAPRGRLCRRSSRRRRAVATRTSNALSSPASSSSSAEPQQRPHPSSLLAVLPPAAPKNPWFHPTEIPFTSSINTTPTSPINTTSTDLYSGSNRFEGYERSTPVTEDEDQDANGRDLACRMASYTGPKSLKEIPRGAEAEDDSDFKKP